MIEQSEEETIKTFNELEIATKRFSKLRKETLKNTKTIRIFRLILGLSQRSMAKKLRIRPVILSNLENENRKITPKILNDTYFFLTNEMKILDKNTISLSNVLNKFREFKIFSKTGVKNKELLETSKKITRLELEKFTISSLKNSRRTEEEIIIKNLLLKNRINFVEQYPVLDSRVSKGGLLIADFFIQTESSKIVIETCKITRTKSEAERQLSRLLAFKAYRIKKIFPDIISIAVIKTDLQLNSSEIGIIKEAFDFVLLNNFEGLTNVVKNALGVGFEPA